MARKIEVQIVGDASSLNRALGKAEKSTSGFSSKLGGLAKTGAIGAAIGGVAVLGKTLFDSVGAARESEKAQARLENALKGAGKSYDAHSSAIQNAIDKTSNLAALDDEDLSDSFAKLVRTSGNVKQSLDGMALAADIARARNISLEAATKLVEKAQLGNEQAFKKVGLEMEKGATAQETLAAAQAKFAGSAEAYGNTTAGAQERLGVAFENLQEKIGQKLLPVLASLAEALLSLVTWGEENWPKFEKVFNDAMDHVRTVLEALTPTFEAFLTYVKSWVAFFQALFAGDWDKAWQKFKEVVVNWLKLAREVIELAWPLFKAAALKLGELAVDGLKAGIVALPGAVKAAIELGIDAIKALGRVAFDAAKVLAGRILDGIEDGLKALAGKLKQWVIAPINFVIGQVNGVLGRINSALEFSTPSLKVAGKTVVPSVGFNAPDIPAIPTLHSGGPVMRDGLHNLQRGEYVLPRGANGAVVVHVHGSVTTERDLVQAVRDGLDQIARRNGGTQLA